MISHVIFDCDGVLLDSEKISMDVDLALLAENGIDFTESEMHRRFVGTTFESMIAEIEMEFGKSVPKYLGCRKDVLMLDHYRRELKTVPGVVDLLRQINIQKSIVTNGPRHPALATLPLTGLQPVLGHWPTTFEDVHSPSPAPHPSRPPHPPARLAPTQRTSPPPPLHPPRPPAPTPPCSAAKHTIEPHPDQRTAILNDLRRYHATKMYYIPGQWGAATAFSSAQGNLKNPSDIRTNNGSYATSSETYI